MNHGKKTEEVAFPRPGKKQSVREARRWFGVQVITEAAAQRLITAVETGG